MPAFEGFEEYQLERLAKLASDAAKRADIENFQVGADALETEVGEILISTGLCNEDSEGGRLWAELTNEGPSHRGLRDAAAAAAIADNPLDPSVLDKDLEPRLGALIIARWSPRWRREDRSETPRLRNLVWRDLADTEQLEIRDMIRHLAVLLGEPRPKRQSAENQPRYSALSDRRTLRRADGPTAIVGRSAIQRGEPFCSVRLVRALSNRSGSIHGSRGARAALGAIQEARRDRHSRRLILSRPVSFSAGIFCVPETRRFASPASPKRAPQRLRWPRTRRTGSMQATRGKSKETNNEAALTAIVRLLARRAAREVFASTDGKHHDDEDRQD